MEKSLVREIAEKVGAKTDVVTAVIDEFALQLNRRFFEYRGMNGDYVGEELHYEIGPQAFYHLLGFLDTFSERYPGWQPGDASEYLLRLGLREVWGPYRRQMDGWVERSK